MLYKTPRHFRKFFSCSKSFLSTLRSKDVVIKRSESCKTKPKIEELVFGEISCILYIQHNKTHVHHVEEIDTLFLKFNI